MKLVDFEYNVTEIRIVDKGSHSHLFDNEEESLRFKDHLKAEIYRTALERMLVFNDTRELFKKGGLDNVEHKIPARPFIALIFLTFYFEMVTKVDIREH